MAQTPFDRTFYIDADMEIIGEGIEEVFDLLGDNDMMFTGLPDDRWYIFNDEPFKSGAFKYCGAVCLYRKTEKTMKFMNDWFKLYKSHYHGKWWPTDENGDPDYDNYPKRLQIWDQFSLFWLTERTEEYKDLKIEIFENDLRWNYWAPLDRTITPMPEDTVLLHLSCMANKDSLG